MAGANPTQKSTWFHTNQFSGSKPDPGKYYDPIAIASSNQVDVTGQGYGAVFAADATNVSITASNGTIVTGFTTGQVYDIGLNGAAVGATGNCYIMKKR